MKLKTTTVDNLMLVLSFLIPSAAGMVAIHTPYGIVGFFSVLVGGGFAAGLGYAIYMHLTDPFQDLRKDYVLEIRLFWFTGKSTPVYRKAYTFSTSAIVDANKQLREMEEKIQVNFSKKAKKLGYEDLSLKSPEYYLKASIFHMGTYEDAIGEFEPLHRIPFEQPRLRLFS